MTGFHSKNREAKKRTLHSLVEVQGMNIRILQTN